MPDFVMDDLTVTKLMPPRSGKAPLSRSALLKRLEGARHQALVLLSAPAGFGKSSLVRQWRQVLVADGAAVAWLNLDAGDDDLGRFMAYVTASLAHADPGLAASAMSLLQRGVRPDRQQLLNALVSDLHRARREVWLVLDSFETIRSPECHKALADLVHFSPENLHFAVTTRNLAELPSAEVVARGHVARFLPQDLAFTLRETQALVAQRTSTAVDAATVTRLHEATRGWPAGIQLAVMAINSGVDLDAYLRREGGLSQDAARLLAETVMARLPPDELEFMVRLSITRRFNDSLCAALGEVPGAPGGLERLCARQPFVQTAGGAAGWYEFHPIFRGWLDNLRAAWDPRTVTELHRRAAQWFSKQGHAPECLHHSLACGEIEIGSRLMLDAVAVAIGERAMLSLVHVWFEQLPKALVTSFPEARLHMAFGPILCNRLEAATELLDGLDESTVDQQWRDGKRVVEVAALLAAGDTVGALAQVDEWPDALLQRTGFEYYRLSCVFAAFACLQESQFERAREYLLRMAGPANAIPDRFAHLGSLVVQGMLYQREGRVAMARRTFDKALEQARQDFSEESVALALVAAGAAETAYEAGSLGILDELVVPRLKLIREYTMPRILFSAYRSLVRLHEIRGEAEAASELLDELEGVAVARRLAWLRAAAIGERVRMHLSQRLPSDVQPLLRRLQELAQPGSAGEGGSANHVLQIAAAASARCALAAGPPGSAASQLEELANDAAARGEIYAATALRVLQARALLAAGDEHAASALFAGALAVGERLGMFRVFLDETDPRSLLAALERAGDLPDQPSPRYLARIHAALRDASGLGPPAGVSPRAAAAFDDALTGRENDALVLLARGLTNRQIADALEVSMDTVKYHLKNLFSKLRVTQRRAAVAEARRRGLLARPRRE